MTYSNYLQPMWPTVMSKSGRNYFPTYFSTYLKFINFVF